VLWFAVFWGDNTPKNSQQPPVTPSWGLTQATQPLLKVGARLGYPYIPSLGTHMPKSKKSRKPIATLKKKKRATDMSKKTAVGRRNRRLDSVLKRAKKSTNRRKK